MDLSHEKISASKYKVCLEYHLGNCKGPCEGLQDEKNYLADIEQAKNILKGNMGMAKSYFKEKMQEIIDADYPIEKSTVSLEEAKAIFSSLKMDAKVNLLSYRNEKTFNIYNSSLL